jgi:uncharacterized lipoprotein YajG
MMKFLLGALLFAGCVHSEPSPLYKIGSCLEVSPEALSQLPPAGRLMTAVVKMSVADVGTTMYVIAYKFQNRVINMTAAAFYDVEQVTKEVDCK